MRLFKFLPIFVLLTFIIIVFRPFFFEGKLPIPADTIIGLYHPWRDQLADKYPNGVPYKNFLITDPVRQQYPWRELAVDQLKQKFTPSWNPYTLAGTPLLGNPQAAAYYPLNFIYWFTSFATGWSLQVVSQIFLGGLFMLLYLRQLKLSTLAQAFGVLSWIGSGFFIAWLEWNTLVQVAIWLPLLLWSLDQKRWLIFISALVSSFLAGHLQVWFYIIALTFFYAVIHQKIERKFFASLAVATFLTFPQWQATLTFWQESTRVVSVGPDWFLPWQHLAQVVAPDFFGNPATLNYFGTWNYGEFVSYIGLVPLIFSLFAVIFGFKKIAFWAIVALISLVFILPNFVSWLPYQLSVPFISSFQPTRLLVVFDFALAILAAYGVEFFLQRKDLKIWVPVAILVTALTVLWLVAAHFNLAVSKSNLYLPTALAVSTLICLIVSKKNKTLALSLLLVLTVFDLARFAVKFESFSPPGYLYPETKITKFLQERSQEEIFRIAALDDRIFPPNFATHYRLQLISGYDSIYLRPYPEVFGEKSRIISSKNYKTDIFNKLNVKYLLSFADIKDANYKLVISEGQTKVYENLSVFPRTSLTSGQAIVILYSPNKIVIETQAGSDGFLVLRDMFYPGWQTTVDGQITPIQRAETIFRGVNVPAGKHTVIFSI